MKKYKKSTVNDVIKYYRGVDAGIPSVATLGRNLTLLAVEGKLNEVYHRDDTITAIQKILLRKSKPNVLLTGAAGCGKTAIAEGLALAIADKMCAWMEQKNAIDEAYKKAFKAWEKVEDGTIPMPIKAEYPAKPPLCECVIYDFSLNSCISGTQYRGQFEEKLDKMMKSCAANGNIVLFIDEIHQLNSIGKSKDGDPSMGQILKPALARAEIRVIGATTSEESKYLTDDKALARRFTEIALPQLYGEAAEETALGIMNTYANLHNVSVEKVSTKFLLDKVQTFLPHTVFPDNFINVVDETLASAVFDGLTEVKDSHFNATLSRLAGVVIV
jgi:ATP-dependent Clp protease ATP-binding subunit ClpE